MAPKTATRAADSLKEEDHLNDRIVVLYVPVCSPHNYVRGSERVGLCERAGVRAVAQHQARLLCCLPHSALHHGLPAQRVVNRLAAQR